MNRTQTRVSAHNRIWHKAGLTGLLLCCAMGCQSLLHRNDPMAVHDPFSDGYQQDASIDKIKGPMERILQAGHYDKTNSLNPNSLKAASSEDFSEYNSARQLFDQGDYAGAESSFKKIAEDHALDESGVLRKRKWSDLLKTRKQLKAHYSDSPLREDSLFMVAESQFRQEELPGAETNYLILLKEFPNTRHMGTATQRLFDIAMTWMNFKATQASDVELAAFSDDGPSSKPQLINNKEYKRPSFLNLSDKKRPTTDTEGRALEALKAIWLNDPTGKLADDALMFTASHYLRTGRYDEAAETYQLLRNEFPQSPHVKDAYVLGAYVSQASYQGASYDGKNLTESRQLQLTALTIFPDLPPEEKKRLQESLQKIDDATVAREFNRAIFWLKKGRFNAVEMTCWHIIHTYPSSKYAGKARGLLAQLPELRTKNSLLLALDGINADSIESLAELPEPPPVPSLAEPQEAAKPSEQTPRRLPGYRLPKLKPIPIPNFLPSWSKDSGQDFEPDQELQSPGEETTAPGRVNLTLGEE